MLLIEEALSSAVIDEKLAFTAARDAFLASSHGGSTYPLVVAQEQKITALGAVLRGTEAGRATQDPITVFDSSGFALQELALAQAILDRVQTDSDRTMETR